MRIRTLYADPRRRPAGAALPVLTGRFGKSQGREALPPGLFLFTAGPGSNRPRCPPSLLALGLTRRLVRLAPQRPDRRLPLPSDVAGLPGGGRQGHRRGVCRRPRPSSGRRGGRTAGDHPPRLGAMGRRGRDLQGRPPAGARDRRWWYLAGLLETAAAGTGTRSPL